MVGGPYPVELRPGNGQVAVVFGIDAGAGKGLLGQEDQVPLGEPRVALHLGHVLHIESLAQLGPHHAVGHQERHAALCGDRWCRPGSNSHFTHYSGTSEKQDQTCTGTGRPPS